MPIFTIRVKGGEDIQNKLNKMSSAVADMRTPLQTAGKYLVEFYQNEVFLSQGGVYGTPWASLKDNTLVQKARSSKLGAGVSPRSILQFTGNLRRSFQLQTTPTYLRINNTADYFKYLQDGTGRMPARRIMMLDNSRKKAITQIITGYLNKALG